MTPTRHDFRVLRDMPTRWMDNDHYGHVNNVAYYSYFDSAVNGWLMEATGAGFASIGAELYPRLPQLVVPWFTTIYAWMRATTPLLHFCLQFLTGCFGEE